MQVTLSLPYLYITLSNFLFLSTSQIGLLVLYGVVSALRSSASAWSTSAGSLIFLGGEVNLGNTDSDKTDTFVERCSKNNTDNEPNSEHQVSTLGCTLR